MVNKKNLFIIMGFICFSLLAIGFFLILFGTLIDSLIVLLYVGLTLLTIGFVIVGVLIVILAIIFIKKNR